MWIKELELETKCPFSLIRTACLSSHIRDLFCGRSRYSSLLASSGCGCDERMTEMLLMCHAADS